MDCEELTKGLRIGSNVNPHNTQAIKDIVIKYWDCFYNAGAKRTILDYEFAIDTGSCHPIYCRKPAYGPHEHPIIMDQIKDLLSNDWIKECEGVWGSRIVLATKPHQEYVTNIKDYI